MTTRTTDPAELQHCLANLKLERDAVLLYEGLAELDKDPIRGPVHRHRMVPGFRWP